MAWIGLLVLLVGCLLAAPVVALVAWGRARRAETRIGDLARDLSVAQHDLRQLVRRIESIAPAEADAPAAVRVPARTEAATAVTPSPMEPPRARLPAVGQAEVHTTHPEVERIASGSNASVSRDRPQPATGGDWERWIGVRGAALLGTLALSLAGLLFFRYSIEHNLISPLLRVVLGSLTGVGCLAAAYFLRRRRYAYTSDGVAGAGVVILYAAFWAAHVRYGLIAMSGAFVLMVLVTATCCVLATRYRSMLIAVTGLIGGFATPLLLSSGSDRPIGLFGYVLLLDVGLLSVAGKRRWPSLGLLSFAGTTLMETLWIGGRMGPDRLLLGMTILVVFGTLFALFGRRFGDVDRGPWLWTRLASIGLPFLFALHFATRADLSPHLVPIGVLLALLAAAASWMGRELRRPHLGSAAAAVCVAVVGSWLMQHRLTPSLAWETFAVTFGLAALFHLFREFERSKRTAGEGTATAALVSSGGFFALLLWTALAGAAPVWPLVAGFVALTGLAYRQAAFPGLGWLQPCAAAALGLGLTSLHLQSRSPLVSPTFFLTLVVAAAAGLFFIARARRADLRRLGMHAAGAFSAIVLLGLPTGFVRVLEPWPALGVAALLGVVVAAVATWLRSGAWYAAAAGCTLLAQVGWMIVRPGLVQSASLTTTAFLLFLVTVAGFTTFPLWVPERFKAQPAAWRTAALAPVLAFLPLRWLFEAAFGDASIGLLPVALGALALAGIGFARRGMAPNSVSRIAEVWFGATAACLFAVAVPLQFEREWITVGWALQGLLLVVAWRRLDHPGLKHLGLALLGAATLRLVANPAVLSYYPRPETPILNWLLYTYFVPFAALLGSAFILRPLEVVRARVWERELYVKGHAVGAVAAGFAAVAVVFVWINLSIADVFATGSRLTLDLAGDPPQRLTVSIAWAVYALVLLVLGMGRDSLGLRWLSLGFLLITIGKVFLYDLGTLQDLYRVASLVGLALSLILVSLLYQRFVFRRPSALSRAG